MSITKNKIQKVEFPLWIKAGAIFGWIFMLLFSILIWGTLLG